MVWMWSVLNDLMNEILQFFLSDVQKRFLIDCKDETSWMVIIIIITQKRSIDRFDDHCRAQEWAGPQRPVSQLTVARYYNTIAWHRNSITSGREQIGHRKLIRQQIDQPINTERICTLSDAASLNRSDGHWSGICVHPTELERRPSILSNTQDMCGTGGGLRQRLFAKNFIDKLWRLFRKTWMVPNNNSVLWPSGDLTHLLLSTLCCWILIKKMMYTGIQRIPTWINNKCPAGRRFMPVPGWQTDTAAAQHHHQIGPYFCRIDSEFREQYVDRSDHCSAITIIISYTFPLPVYIYVVNDWLIVSAAIGHLKIGCLIVR